MKGRFIKALIKYRIRFLYLLIKNRFKYRTILFYPKYPHKRMVLYKICSLLGYNITTNIKKKFNIAINWENTTFRKKYPLLEAISGKKRVLNINCKDISKNKVDLIFKKVFGYSLIINPLKHRGRCVQKSDRNAMKDGKIISCPVNKTDKNFVYLKIINNQVSKSLVQDIRTPVFNNEIPFVYLRSKLTKDRFNNTNNFVNVAKVHDVYSKEEIKKILLFSKKIGLDVGELDILKDKDDKKIYIVDVNNTPWGPPNHLDKEEWKIALEKLAETFWDQTSKA